VFKKRISCRFVKTQINSPADTDLCQHSLSGVAATWHNNETGQRFCLLYRIKYAVLFMINEAEELASLLGEMLYLML